MNRDATTDSNRSSDDELATGVVALHLSYKFVENCVLDADHKALEEHLMSNFVQQSDLDRGLLRGLRVVQREQRQLSHVAPALTVLLQARATWSSNTMLDEQKTPYHIICESPGDHHELLYLMIKMSQQRLIDAYDIWNVTALIYALLNNNVNCVKCLIENGANVTRNDVWLEDRCVYVWSLVASLGNVELLKCLFNRGIDKDSTDEVGQSVLWWVVCSNNVEGVRYLLDMGVSIPNYAPKVQEAQCDFCETEKLLIEYRVDLAYYEKDGWSIENLLTEDDRDPCINAIRYNRLEIVKLLDERGSQICKSFFALRQAVIWGNVDVTSYLLNKYTYPLNIEYIIENASLDKSGCLYTLLSEPGQVFSAKITKLLLDHGADPAKRMCKLTSVNAIMTAIRYGNLEAIAQYIRNGVDINFRSYDGLNRNALPFEASVLCGRQSIAEMLLVSGCSCGMFSLYNNNTLKYNLKPEVEKLMEEWKVQENKVTPLIQRCRSVILNHLSPRADIKIENLPLPILIIKFLRIPELDVIQNL